MKPLILIAILLLLVALTGCTVVHHPIPRPVMAAATTGSYPTSTVDLDALQADCDRIDAVIARNDQEKAMAEQTEVLKSIAASQQDLLYQASQPIILPTPYPSFHPLPFTHLQEITHGH